MRSGRILRQIVRARIKEQVPALTAVSDKATEKSAFPYATMGPSYWVDDSTDCTEGREITLQIDIWHSASNKGVCEDLTDDVATALKGYADQVALTMHPIEIDTARVTDDPDGVSVHGIVVIRAMVESDG
ncbi:DUF3168 domain-containing protein [Paracoccus sp. NGMCC 1.201697]|uniref:DUF3168 domain-containing protein n=1 Tax=Paracoccus broussonetiae subsp. drimophilus TaxID=3373869 RepID=A0ABW7LGZ3_9RHOB